VKRGPALVKFVLKQLASGVFFAPMKEMRRGELGRWGESVAAGHLVAKGHRIIERNWRHRRCEIDLIATIGETTVFVEVKVRSSVDWEEVGDVVHSGQRRRLIRAAHAFLRLRKNVPGKPRFDVIHITMIEGGWRLDHVVDAFLPLHA
jgi:putative endonuclease